MSVQAERAIAYLRQFPQTAHAKLLRVLQKVGFDLQGYIQTQKLQGQVLGHRSGWLSSHIKSNVEDYGQTASVKVGVNTGQVPYAAIHEYGFHGQENVKAHQRIMTVCFGHPIAATPVEVGAFTRTMNMPERSYLRSSLKERRETYIGWLRRLKDAA